MGSMQCLVAIFVAIILEHYSIQNHLHASSVDMSRFATLWSLFDVKRTTFLDVELLGQFLLRVRPPIVSGDLIGDLNRNSRVSSTVSSRYMHSRDVLARGGWRVKLIHPLELRALLSRLYVPVRGAKVNFVELLAALLDVPMGIVLPAEAAYLQARLLLRWPANVPELAKLPPTDGFVADMVDRIVACTPLAVKAETAEAAGEAPGEAPQAAGEAPLSPIGRHERGSGC